MDQETDNFIGAAFAGCKIISKIGQGGMGSVYKARHEALDMTVCVKLLSPDLTREERNVEFFMREARSAAKLEHKNIVHIYNFGNENGAYFIIMTCIEGKSLADTIAEKGPMSVETATDVIVEVLEGLEHAHSKTIMHRDIKPSNILLGNDGHPRIVDFGLARSVSEEKQLTMPGEMVGTAYFMSPEQGLAGVVDQRADLYSTGATYFYLLTGKYPFEGKSSIEVIHKHISEPFPNIMLVNPDVPLWVSRVLERVMRKKPEDRYQSAAQLISEIKRLKASEKDGSAVSHERSIEFAELSARLEADAKKTAPPPPPPTIAAKTAVPAAHPAPAHHVKKPAPVPAWLAPAPAQTPRKGPLNDKNLQLPILHDAIKTAMHLAITMATVACFILAGSAGTPPEGTPASLLYPLTANPYGAGILLAAGTGLMIWAISLKPIRSASLRVFLSAAAAIAAYAGAVHAPSPEAPDIISKTFFSIQTALASVPNYPIYSVFLFLVAANIPFQPKPGRTVSLALYAASLFFTYAYFTGDPSSASAEKAYLPLAALSALAGLTSAITQKRRLAALFFLGANAMLFMAFTTPPIKVLTDRKVKQENLRVQKLRTELELYSLQEFSPDGKPVQKASSRRGKLTPVPKAELARQSRAEYYAGLAAKLKSGFFDAAGLVLLAFFLMLAANLYFVEETLLYYKRQQPAED